MNNLELFKNESFGEIRTLIEKEQVLFCAKDVASALGYSNTNKAINDHCKKPVMIWGNDSLGRQQETKFIPESDVYRLIAIYKKTRWVFNTTKDRRSFIKSRYINTISHNFKRRTRKE